MENIPEKYWAKVKTHEQASPQEKPPSIMDSVKVTVASSFSPFKQKVGEWLQSFGITLPSAASKTAAAPSQSVDMSTSQSKILNYAGVVALILLCLMYFSKSQLVRLLGLCLLLTLGFATPILLYVSDDGPMTSMKGKAIAAGQAQQDRLKQVAP